MDKFIKEPHKAALYYREESLRAMAAGQQAVACSWRLAADAARQVVRQSHKNSILVPIGMPFVENFAQFALSLQKANDGLDHLKKNSHLDRLKKEPSQEALSRYRYWMFFLVASCSHHFEQEMMQLQDAAKKYQTILPKVLYHIEQAFHFFKKAQQFQKKRLRSIQRELIVSCWVSAAYEAAHLANITVQRAAIAEEKNISFLEQWETMTRYVEKALSLRIKAAEASELQEEQQVLQYSLAAFAASEGSEYVVQMMKEIISNKDFFKNGLGISWQEAVALSGQVAEQRALLATSQTSHSSTAVSWLEAALEANFNRVKAIISGYYRVAFYWEQSQNFSQRLAAWILRHKMEHNVARYWYKIAFYQLEKKAQKKIPIMLMEKVFFCMTEDCFPTPAWREKWEKGKFLKFAELNKSLTVHTWLYQTGTLLQQAGVECYFFTKMPHLPHRGIIVTMSGLLYCYPKGLRFSSSLFVAGIVADAGIPHPTAMLHLIPNKITTKHLPFTEFIPHWPQPFLIPRDVRRGERFETIAFMGDPQNIAPELCSKEWHLRLEKELGLRFVCRDFDDWHNFSDVDAIVAIRDFSTRRFYYKPAHKLHNAWLAGVPFIGGRESAFIGDGNPGHDFLIAHSAEEVFSYLKQLKEDPVFRSKLVKNGNQSVTAFTREAVLQSWKSLVQETLPVRALKWERSSAIKRTFFMIFQRWSCEIQSFIYKYYKPKNYTFVVGKKPDLFAWASPNSDVF